MIDEFLRYLEEKNYSPDTIRGYRLVLGYFKGKEMSRELIQQYQEKIMRLKAKSRKHYVLDLKRYLDRYYPELSKHVIVPKVEKSLPVNVPSKMAMKKYLQLPEVSSFKGIRDRAILELLYSGGMRRMELVNLKIQDIDLSKELVRIIQGKGKKDRVIPISSSSVDWLKKYLNQVRAQLSPKSDYVFLSKIGERIGLSTIGILSRKYTQRSPHKLRHAYATHLLENGMKETSLQRLLGHSSVATTHIYTQVTITEIKKSYTKYHPRDKWDW